MFEEISFGEVPEAKRERRRSRYTAKEIS